MIDSLYTKYFQKSRSFLYPALGIKKSDRFNPAGTYISMQGLVEPDEMKLVVSFKHDASEEFKAFENMMLVTNPLYIEKVQIEGYNIYLFDFSIYQSDWYNFLLGKYSKLSVTLKKAIKLYYGDKSTEYEYIETFLHPEKYFGIYAKLLNVELSLLKEVGELCDACDLEKETLNIPVEHLENLKKVL